ncbi:SDR family oxidoreductase [Sphingomonas sp. BIUV-7]|uniref:SDR family oxidoreductase n=1 Tax=Sphingomonas natans TaxID=3063330 RepID=A0ABT8Y9L7_9SPHN|nr:SDR family oxidoreductase [Sphingomonas sp. BIUV-7]MDO6414672.1 SDR family oxidoreductase [Sphingomonas sp. BIUV-7]
MTRLHLKPIEQQVIVITGASSGIGLATAHRAALAGACVFLIARNEEALAAIAQEIQSRGGMAGHAAADVGDPDAVAAAADAAIARFGRIDTWVNNAGVAIYAPLVETPFDEHERLFRTNYFGVVNGALAALPHLQKQGGALITIGSIVSDLQTPIMGAYAASKHAAKGFIDSLRAELTAADAPVSVTLIKPSGIDTPIAQHAANHLPGEAMIPPPVYDPELVAEAVLHAAIHPQREITVGGIGRAGELIGQHVPGLVDRLSGLITPVLDDQDQPRTESNNLFEPTRDGEIRSGRQAGRRFSVYGSAGRHPVAIAALGGLATLGLYLTLRRPPADQA